MIEINKRVLVVDDDPETIKSYQNILAPEKKAHTELAELLGKQSVTKEQFLLTTADQGKIAVQMVAKAQKDNSPFSLAIIDMRMPPGINGLETARLIREIDKKVYIAIITAFADYSVEEMDEILTYNFILLKKPFDREEIRQVARNFCLSWSRDQTLKKQYQDLEFSREELANTAKELSLANKYKSEFLANMSHELRTPLNSILALAADLSENQANNLDQDEVNSAKTIITVGQGLLVIINDLMDLAMIEAGRMKLKIASQPLANLESKFVAKFSKLALAQGLGFEVLIAPDLPKQIRMDWPRLTQALHYLVDNAFKFTEKGGIKLTVDWATPASLTELEIKENAKFLALTVQDSGIGISNENIMAILEPFRQVDGSLSRKFEGIGLGLAICQKICIALGGKLAIQSTEGQGSEFTIILPVEHAKGQLSTRPLLTNASSPAPKVKQDAGDNIDILPEVKAALSGKKIFIIATDMRQVFSLLKGFKHTSSPTIVETNFSKIGDQLGNNRDIDFILLDLSSHELDGEAVIAELQRYMANRPSHLITFNNANDKNTSLEVQASLPKPVDIKELLTIMKELL